MKPQRVRLDGEMSIYRAAELKETLLAPLAAGTLVELDLSAVSELDTAGVQLLLLARQTARGLGGDVCVLASSAPVQDLLDLLGLADSFAHRHGAAALPGAMP
ncbi:STAS domain-containing protein [Massilia sp. DWR3-1-1]|uniref:STAS domain-containing protein n=1 Tax=Massilia sp. DWR3-1-1 TaxID=2804559 RepID=UPI003CE97112